MTDLPLVSIIVPCRNEQKFIAQCLESIVANDYPKEWLEVFVIDGMSEDSTREIVDGYARRFSYIRILENVKKITPSALNIGIRAAKGGIILRLDAHSEIEPDYISRCVECLMKYEADNVGGNMRTVPTKGSYLGQAIAAALSHRFGVGNSYFRVHTKEPKWVDTVFGGCYRRDVFDRIGLFNESLTRGQDMEFNLRLKKAGGRILLVPDIVSHYYARSDMISFWNHNWTNGVWAVLPFLYSSIMPVSWRHLVPLAFVLGLMGSAVLALVSQVGVWMLALIAGTYAGVNLIASVQGAVQERNYRHLLYLPVVFASLHLSYGLGSLWALPKVLFSRQFWKSGSRGEYAQAKL